eukprot:909984_1
MSCRDFAYIFVLVWTIMGGVWLPIWASIVWIYWMVLERLVMKEKGINVMMWGLVDAVGVYLESRETQTRSKVLFTCKAIESVIGLSMITVFGVLSFHCGICAVPSTRQIFDNTNDRILTFWTLGV